MLKTEVIAYYGTLEKVASALGISVPAVSQWREIIPEKNAYKLQEITNRELTVDPILYQKKENSDK